MTTNVTSPALYALGTVTTLVSFLAIIVSLGSIALIQRRRSRKSLVNQEQIVRKNESR